MPITFTDLPRSPAEWQKAQRSLEVDNIAAVGQLDSASNIQQPQFLLLRALWDIKMQAELEIRNWLEEEYIKDAVSLLDGCSDWKRYLESFSQHIELEQRPFPNLGAFTLVKYSQLEVEAAEEKSSSASVLVSPRKTRSMTLAEKLRNITPSKNPTNRRKFYNAEHEDSDDDEDWPQKAAASHNMSPWSAAKKGEQKVLYPPTEDEQIVNTALLNFLTAVTIAHPSACLRWCLARKTLQFDCKNENHGAITYQARTDGYLRGPNHSTAYAIIEVKPFVRDNTPHTRWQETAQMAAWISKDPSPQGAKFQ
jgi:hypothetical protein